MLATRWCPRGTKKCPRASRRGQETLVDAVRRCSVTNWLHSPLECQTEEYAELELRRANVIQALFMLGTLNNKTVSLLRVMPYPFPIHRTQLRYLASSHPARPPRPSPTPQRLANASHCHSGGTDYADGKIKAFLSHQALIQRRFIHRKRCEFANVYPSGALALAANHPLPARSTFAAKKIALRLF